MIFVSSDRDDDAFSEYFATMPFLALPFVKRHLKAELSSSSKFDVSGIPSLIFIDGATGVTITKNGRAGISAPTFIENFPYYPKPSYDLSETTDDIQDHPSLIVLCEDSENEIKDTISTLTNDVALEMKESGLNDELRYFTGRGGGPLGQIKGMCGFPVVITPHEHALVEKENTGGWYCDGCRGNTAESSRYRCGSGCDFDYCQNCKDASEIITEKSEEEKLPKMMIFDLKKKRYYMATKKGSPAEVTKENMIEFLTRFTKDELEGVAME